MKVLIHGSTGRMGKILCDLLTAGHPGLTLAARVSPEETLDAANCVYTNLQEVDCEVDGVIDFSHHSATPALLDFAIANRLPLVLCTTGHTEDEKELIGKASERARKERARDGVHDGENGDKGHREAKLFGLIRAVEVSRTVRNTPKNGNEKHLDELLVAKKVGNGAQHFLLLPFLRLFAREQ